MFGAGPDESAMTDRGNHGNYRYTLCVVEFSNVSTYRLLLVVFLVSLDVGERWRPVVVL